MLSGNNMSGEDLVNAAGRNEVATVTRLLNQGVDVNYQNEVREEE